MLTQIVLDGLYANSTTAFLARELTADGQILTHSLLRRYTESGMLASNGCVGPGRPRRSEQLNL